MQGQVYYIIGDIHGQYDRLLRRLKSIGLVFTGNDITFTNGKLIFLGDLVDRGPDSRKVVELVKKLHEAGVAEVILGNHEFNFIGYLTKRDKKSFLRRHTRKNTRQHRTTIKSYKGHSHQLNEHLAWFRTLPVYFENDHVRAVHACWDKQWIEWLKQKHPAGFMDEKFFRNSYESNKKSFWCIERLLKGPELNLLGGEKVIDSDGNQRSGIRYKWWQKNEGKSLKEVSTKWSSGWKNQAFSFDMVQKDLAYAKKEKPLFIGHYNFTHQPEFNNKNFACLDCSDKEGNRVLVYRHEAGKKLSEKHLIY